MPVFNGTNVPNEIFSKILMKLDGRSLHTARLVSKEWNLAVEEQVLGTVGGRREMERTLQRQWREATPARLEFNIGGQGLVRILTITDSFAVLFSYTEMSDVFRVVNIREGVEVMEVSYSSSDRVPEALLSEDVLLVVRDVGGVLEVLAWIVPTRQEIFNKKFPGVWPVFDHHNKQVMLGSNTRLEISGNTVIESTVNLPPPTGSGFLRLRAFSHPHYLTRGPTWPSTLWKIDGTTRVELGAVDGGDPVFCPTRDILIICSRASQDQIKFSFYNSLTGQLIKVRDLILPTSFNLSGLYVNVNQLVVGARQQPGGETALLVYELEILLSQAADQDISPRVLQIDKPPYYHLNRIDVNKTSVNVLLRNGERYKIITLDFWNCET